MIYPEKIAINLLKFPEFRATHALAEQYQLIVKLDDIITEHCNELVIADDTIINDSLGFIELTENITLNLKKSNVTRFIRSQPKNNCLISLFILYLAATV